MSVIKHTDRVNMTNAINSARAKWGLSQSATSPSSGSIITASDINNALALLREAKTASGWSGTVSSDVKIGDYITEIFTSVVSQANTIKDHCPCFGNCSGSCTGGCSGTCTSTCTGGCSTTCTGGCSSMCGGCGMCPCSCGGCGAGGNKRISPLSPYYIFEVNDILDDLYWRALLDE